MEIGPTDLIRWYRPPSYKDYRSMTNPPGSSSYRCPDHPRAKIERYLERFTDCRCSWSCKCENDYRYECDECGRFLIN